MADFKIFSSALSQKADAQEAVREIVDKVRKDLKGNSCDLAVLFVSEGFQDFDSKDVVAEFQKMIPSQCLIGCNSSGVVGDHAEVEMQPAVSVMAMHLPETKIHPFHLSPQEIELIPDGAELIRNLDLYPTDQPKFICLADPMSCDVTKLLSLLNEGYGPSPVIGGLSSGVVAGAENWLTIDGEIYAQGAVAVALSGNIAFESVVSQGCRPIGEPYIITKCEENILQELAGKPALEILSQLYEKLPPADQALAKHSLFVGLAMDEKLQVFGRGDFLIRNIMGVHYEQGSLVIGEMLRPGQTLQFQLRDAETAKEDFQILLKHLENASDQTRGGILVSCCGRGKGLFKESDHDVRLIQSLKGPVPLTGFFANGEFGPIHHKNYIHGYTSSLTILK